MFYLTSSLTCSAAVPYLTEKKKKCLHLQDPLYRLYKVICCSIIACFSTQETIKHKELDMKNTVKGLNILTVFTNISVVSSTLSCFLFWVSLTTIKDQQKDKAQISHLVKICFTDCHAKSEIRSLWQPQKEQMGFPQQFTSILSFCLRPNCH